MDNYLSTVDQHEVEARKTIDFAGSYFVFKNFDGRNVLRFLNNGRKVRASVIRHPEIYEQLICEYESTLCELRGKQDILKEKIRTDLR